MDQNPLQQLLLERSMSKEPIAPSGLPAPTPKPKSHLPPAWKRYLTGLRMQEAVRNNWQPSPTLVKILEGK